MTTPKEIKLEDLSPAQQKQIRLQMEIQKQIQEQTNKKLFKWHSEGITVIKDQIAARKKLGLKNDWKIEFLESKINLKHLAMKKLRALVK